MSDMNKTKKNNNFKELMATTMKAIPTSTTKRKY